MDDQVILPAKVKHHPATAVMLNYFNNKVGMKKLDEWKEFFAKREEKNELAGRLKETAEKIIIGEAVEELDFVSLVWMMLRFHKDEEIEKEKKELEKLRRKMAVK